MSHQHYLYSISVGVCMCATTPCWLGVHTYYTDKDLCHVCAHMHRYTLLETCLCSACMYVYMRSAYTYVCMSVYCTFVCVHVIVVHCTYSPRSLPRGLSNRQVTNQCIRYPTPRRGATRSVLASVPVYMFVHGSLILSALRTLQVP